MSRLRPLVTMGLAPDLAAGVRIPDYSAEVPLRDFEKQDPVHALLAISGSDGVLHGWVLSGQPRMPGIANLRGVSTDSSLLFGGSKDSAWSPDHSDPGSAVLVRGGYSVRALGRWQDASPEVTKAQWKARPHGLRAGFLASEMARSLGLRASDLVTGLAAAPESTTEPLPSTWRCFWLVTSRVIFTKLGEHRVHQIVDYTFNSESGRWDRTSNA